MSKKYVKVYLFFLVDTGIYDDILYKYGNELENEYVKDSTLLYAWTSKKKYMKKFCKLRKDVFNIMSINIDIERYNDFAETYDLQEIINERVGEVDDVYPTLYEYNMMTDYRNNTIISTLSDFTESYPLIFNDKYIKELDFLLYNNSYNMKYDTYIDVDSCVRDNYEHNMSYGITGEYGYDINMIIDTLDIYTIYKYIFSDIILN
jgi:hypothetical protein